LSGLVRSYDPETGLFHAKLVQTADGSEAVGQSFRYSGMAAIGLTTAGARGFGDGGLPVAEICARLDERALQGCDPLDLSLVLWGAAIADRPTVRALLGRVGEEYRNLRRWHTSMALSWALAGVEHTARLGGRAGESAARLADSMAHDLLRYQRRRTGLFGMRALRPRRALLTALVESRIGTFANQIYPIYALSLHAARTGKDEAIQAVRRCVHSVCRAQGEQGQWWWMVDTKTGRWVDRYPVYAVHQDAMAPFGLHAARAYWDGDTDAHIRRGLDCLFGDNELGVSLVDEEQGVIWRAIQREDSISDGDYGAPSRTLWRRKLTGLGLGVLGRLRHPSDRLEVLRECRTYHLGWVLFASEALEHAESGQAAAPTDGGRVARMSETHSTRR
ncbi:MAG: hypothetical protein MUQ26_03135, partial [Armatimonadetes bacterium]|nr:hypothetical protein [Armatimonadota bacterium]